MLQVFLFYETISFKSLLRSPEKQVEPATAKRNPIWTSESDSETPNKRHRKEVGIKNLGLAGTQNHQDF